MHRFLAALAALCASIAAPPAWSSDACSTRAVVTSADVSVSDGSEFSTQSYFHSKNAAAIRHIRDDEQLVAVEGPVAWARRGDKAQAGSDFFRQFALGHQYHALLLYFDRIASNPRRGERIRFAGADRSAVTADYPYGGQVRLVDGDREDRPAGLPFAFPEADPITAEFGDWRTVSGLELPFHIRIDDGDRVFDYRYTDVDVGTRSPLWFFDAVPAPAIDELELYRLHRKILAGHCLGDADLIADLSAPEISTANRGEVRRSTNEDLRERFTALFQRLDYTAYIDRVEPLIEVSDDVAWMLVEVQARGAETSSGIAFDEQWAWGMFAAKIDGVWLHSGNVSNRKPPR